MDLSVWEEVVAQWNRRLEAAPVGGTAEQGEGTAWAGEGSSVTAGGETEGELMVN